MPQISDAELHLGNLCVKEIKRYELSALTVSMAKTKISVDSATLATIQNGVQKSTPLGILGVEGRDHLGRGTEALHLQVLHISAASRILGNFSQREQI